jgi:nicotinamidase-related amidase
LGDGEIHFRYLSPLTSLLRPARVRAKRDNSYYMAAGAELFRSPQGRSKTRREKRMNELILDPRHTAVVVIDIQKGVVKMPGNPHATPGVVANCVRLVAAARRVGAQSVLVHVGLSRDGADALRPAADQPVPGIAAMPPDWSDLLPELGSHSTDIVIRKRQWGAFYGTDLDLQLRRRGLRTIVLCGICTEFGVESTARDAFELGYEQVFAEDAMTGRSAESHANSIAHIFPRMGRVRSSEEILAALEACARTV